MSRFVSPRSALVLMAVVALAGLLWLPTDTTQASGINASLFCEPGNNGALCEAGPFSPGYSYTWSATGNLTVGNGGAINSIGCIGESGGGVVTVTVSAPGVGSDTASRQVGCSGPGSGPPWGPFGSF